MVSSVFKGHFRMNLKLQYASVSSEIVELKCYDYCKYNIYYDLLYNIKNIIHSILALLKNRAQYSGNKLCNLIFRTLKKYLIEKQNVKRERRIRIIGILQK